MNLGLILQIAVNSLFIGSLYALLTLGFNLVYNTTRFFNLAYGAYILTGAYLFYYFFDILKLSFFLSFSLALIASGFVAVLSEKLVFLKLRKKEASSLVLLLSSLGLLAVFEGIFAIFFSSGFVSSGIELKRFNFTYASFGVLELASFFLSFLFLILLLIFLKYSYLGKKIRAVSDSYKASQIIGLNSDRIILYLFFFAGVISALVGVFILVDSGVDPTSGMKWVLKGVIAVIIGGLGSYGGGVLGSYLLSLIEGFGILNMGAEWQDLIAFLVLVLFLIFKPQGILGR